MFANKTRVLLILPSDILERARVLAGRTTTKLRLTVSLQIVLRALIEEGLKRADDRALLANIEEQAQAVRRSRSLARRRAGSGAASHDPPPVGGRAVRARRGRGGAAGSCRQPGRRGAAPRGRRRPESPGRSN